MKAQPGDLLVLYRPSLKVWPRPRPGRDLAQIYKRVKRGFDIRAETHLQIEEECDVILLPVKRRASVAK